MSTGDRIFFICEYKHCENEPRLMKPSEAAYQRFCSKSCGSKNAWKTRKVAKTPKIRETCSVAECNKEQNKNGFCKQHYMRWYRYGDPLVLTRKAGSCASDCTCSRHNAKRGVRVPSAPCKACGTVKMVQPCNGPEGNKAQQFCDQSCWRDWQKDQATIRRAAGNAKAWDMPLSEFQERLASQNNNCAICSKQITGRDIHRDHDHDTGKWRGLLCNNCNRGLGHFQDDPRLLMAAAEYLVTGGVIFGAKEERIYQ
jgi:hypothetical protein